jgi:hypothetical protein
MRGGLPYEGEVSPERVELVARLMKQIGVQHIGVADTIGVGTPVKVQRAMEAALKHYDLNDISGHFHDTYGQALGNTLASLEMGVWQYDTSSAGLGGCPYAKGATGNVATEDVVYMLQGMGIDTGIDLDKLIDAGKYISDFPQRKPNSRAATAILKQESLMSVTGHPRGGGIQGIEKAGALIPAFAGMTNCRTACSASRAHCRRGATPIRLSCSTTRPAPRSRRPTRWASRSARSPRASSSAASRTTRRCW